MDPCVAEVAERTGIALSWVAPLTGGEQGGAWLVQSTDGEFLVLKVQPDPVKAQAVLRAGPVITAAVSGGWPTAAWRHWGVLDDGTAFVLQQHLVGSPVERLDVGTVRAVITANATQAGLGHPDAFDDSAQLVAVTRGDHPWREVVASRSPRGAALVERGSAMIRTLGPVALPDRDLVHGDYSSANMIITDTGIAFVDCETVGRGTRVRDLADLHRQGVVQPGTDPVALDLLRRAAVEVAGPAVFLTCLVAVGYNNLAWWAEHRSVDDFDQACDRLRDHLDHLERSGTG